MKTVRIEITWRSTLLMVLGVLILMSPAIAAVAGTGSRWVGDQLQVNGSSGNDGIVFKTAGLRLHLSTGANDWISSDATTVTFNGPVGTQMGTSATTATQVGIANTNVTPVNSNGNASNLISYTLPANALTTTGRCLRIVAEGTALNNANAKTVSLAFGSQTIISKQLNVSLANAVWKLEAVVCRTGLSQQEVFAEGWNQDAIAVSGTDGPTILYAATHTAGTQTETAQIVIKGVATTATTTDITQNLLVVEYM